MPSSAWLPPETNTPNHHLPTPKGGLGSWQLAVGSYELRGLLRRIGRRLEQQLLRAPVRQLADDDAVRITAIDLVHRAELLQLLAGLAEAADDLPVQLHLVELAVVEVVRVVRVRREEVLMRARRDAHRPRRADVQVLCLEVQLVVEHLDAVVGAVRNVDVALRIDRK